MWTWMDEKSACGQTTYFARSIACVNRSGRRPLSLRERQLLCRHSSEQLRWKGITLHSATARLRSSCGHFCPWLMVNTDTLCDVRIVLRVRVDI
jgi:hypothetical protein